MDAGAEAVVTILHEQFWSANGQGQEYLSHPDLQTRKSLAIMASAQLGDLIADALLRVQSNPETKEVYDAITEAGGYDNDPELLTILKSRMIWTKII